MAILQISRISNRSGLTEDLPQLYGAELGWCVDSRRLFIGNGTLEEGAPVIGNTEILTEFSDITVLSQYTYEDIAVGYAVQTGPTSSDPVVRTVQAKLDDQASVRDFGAVGDGVADDTDAINRALFQLYCRENNTQIRRSLFFPAGTYRVTETIIIPTYAKLEGEGANCTTIYLDTSSDISSLSAYVARYGDSRQQTGVNIGANGAVPPRNIEISSMTFQTVETTDVFLVEDAQDCWFTSVGFTGPLTVTDISDPGFNPGITNIAGVRILTNTGIETENVIWDRCYFSGTTYGVACQDQLDGSTITNSRFETLYQGVSLSNDVTGMKIVHNMFDIVYDSGVVFGAGCDFNVTAYNVFYNVANGIGAGIPQASVIDAVGLGLVSIGDQFERGDADALVFPRVLITGSSSSGGSGITMGAYTRQTGISFTIVDGASNQQVLQLKGPAAFNMTYTIVRGQDTRSGVLLAVTGSTNPRDFSDDYTESADLGVTFNVTQATNTFTVTCTATSTGFDGILYYSIEYLN